MLQISDQIPGSFHYDSELWTNNDTLNAQYTNITSGIDVKLSSYSSQALEAVRVCVGSLDKCVTLQVEAKSSKDLFSGEFRRRTDIDQHVFQSLFQADELRSRFSPGNASQCMQRPGFNSQCSSGNKARFGFCGNLPAQPCQPNDDDDADFAIGLGLAGQSRGGAGGAHLPSTMLGAGYSDYFLDGIAGEYTRSFQAWVFVLAPGAEIQSELFPPPAPSYIHVNHGTCDTNHWMQIDLGSEFLLGRLHRWFFYTDRSYCNQAVRLSPTGQFIGEESVVFACKTYAQCGIENAAGKSIVFEPTQARFVRYYVSRNSLDAGVGHVSEIEVFGWPLGLDRNSSKFSQAEYHDSMLVLNVSKTIYPGEAVEVFIPSDLGMTLPIDGIRHNQSSIGIAANASLGPVAINPMTPISLTMAVGSFARSQKVDMTPRRAGTSANLILSFSPKMRLVENDTVTFTLRNVVGSSSNLCFGPAAGLLSKFSRASWVLELSELVLTVADTAIEVDENVSVVIPSSAGLLLPSAGIVADTQDFTVSANVQGGSIPQLPLTYDVSSPAIGVLNDTTLSFDVGCAGGRISGFNLSLSVGMDILAGQWLLLTIPGGANPDSFTCKEFFRDSDGIDQCRRGTCSGEFCPGKFVFVSGNSSHLFPRAEWMHPAQIDSENLTPLSVNSSDGGTRCNETCSDTCAQYCITDTCAQYCINAHGSNASSLEQCMHLCTAAVVLPYDDSMLMFKAVQTVLATSRIELRVSLSSDFILPKSLVQADIEGITLESNTVLPSRVHSVLGLGKFKPFPTLELSSTVPDSLTELTMSFELRDALLPLSTLIFELRGFEQHCTSNCRIGNASTTLQTTTIEGADAVLFGYTPSSPCSDTMPTVFVGCDWSASAIGMNVQDVCYSIHCPPGCNLDEHASRHVYSQCGHNFDVFLEGSILQGRAYELFPSSMCRAGIYSGVISDQGGTFLVARTNTSSEARSCAGTRNNVHSRVMPLQDVIAVSAFQVYVRPLQLPITWDSESAILSVPVGHKEIIANRTVVFSVPNFVAPHLGVKSNSATASMLAPPLGEERGESLGGGFFGLPPRLLAADGLISTAKENEGVCKLEGKRLLDTQPSGSVGNTSLLDFNPRFSGAATDVRIEFVPQMDITANEYFLVRLPNFVGVPFSDTPWLAGHSAPNLRVSWSMQESTLNFTVQCGSLLLAEEKVSVTLLRHALLRIPLSGIQSSEIKDFTLEFRSSSPMSPQAFFSFKGVGSFTDTPMLSFGDAPMAGQETEIILSVIPEMDIQKMEDVTLFLPDFQGPTGPLNCSSFPSQYFTTAAWDLATFTLRIVASSPVPASQLVTISLAPRVRLPVVGIRSNQQALTISSGAAAGNVEAQPIPKTEAVGSFLESAISFHPAVAGKITSINLFVVPAMKIAAKEKITLLLLGFTGKSVETFETISIPGGRIGNASWNVETHELTLTVDCADKAMYSQEMTKVIIPFSVGISLPEQGVRLATNDIKISTTSVFGSVGPTLLTSVQSVGSFLVNLGYSRGGPSIEFTNEQTEPIQITVFFRPQVFF